MRVLTDRWTAKLQGEFSLSLIHLWRPSWLDLGSECQLGWGTIPVFLGPGQFVRAGLSHTAEGFSFSFHTGSLLADCSQEPGEQNSVIGDLIGEEIGDQIGEEIGDQIGEDTGDKIGEEIGDQKNEEIGDQMGEEIGDQMRR
ncbi:unnamed protein product [Boreogadus saida]